MPRHPKLQFTVDWVVPVILCLLIPIFAAIYVADHNRRLALYHASVMACERENEIRARLNEMATGLPPLPQVPCSQVYRPPSWFWE